MDITGETKLHFLTTLPIHQSKAGELLLNDSGFNLMMRYDQKTITVSGEKKEIDVPQLERANGQVIYRIVHKMKVLGLIGDNILEIKTI